MVWATDKSIPRLQEYVVRLAGRWLFAASILLFLSVGNSALAQGNMNQIKHIVFLVRENRSFDHYFGLFPGADGASTAILSNGQKITLGHATDATPQDLCHTLVCARVGVTAETWMDSTS